MLKSRKHSTLTPKPEPPQLSFLLSPQRKHLSPSLIAYNAAISACEKSAEWRRALHLLGPALCNGGCGLCGLTVLGEWFRILGPALQALVSTDQELNHATETQASVSTVKPDLQTLKVTWPNSLKTLSPGFRNSKVRWLNRLSA